MAKIWTTYKVNEVLRQMEQGSDSEPDTSCFFQGDIDLRNSYITFEYTPEEQQELLRCANDIVYFANNFCHVMTDEGISKITLRPYQEEMLKAFQDNRYIVLMAARQIGKCSLFNTKIKLKSKDNKTKILSIGNFYFEMLSKERTLTLIEKTKWLLYRLYDKLD